MKSLYKATIVHHDIYDYSLVEYINYNEPVKIICPIHKVFNQKVSNHLSGSGCPLCSLSKGETKIINILNDKNIKCEHEYSFDDCLSPKGNKLRFDFYLPNNNLCIEYDGEFHFHEYEHIPKEKFNTLQLHDKIKNEYCKQNNIKLLRIPYTQFDNIEFLINQELSWIDNIIDEIF